MGDAGSLRAAKGRSHRCPNQTGNHRTDYAHRHEGFSIKFHVLIPKSSARPISLRQSMQLFVSTHKTSRHGRPLQGRFPRQLSQGARLTVATADSAPHRRFSASRSAWFRSFQSFSFYPIFLRPRRPHSGFISIAQVSRSSLQH